jgi:hypothetical protein
MSSRHSSRTAASVRDSTIEGLALAFCVGVGAYCLLSAVAGPAGILAYRDLSSRRDEMARNLVALEERNRILREDLEDLRFDPDRTAREARGLGYLRKGESALVLPGQSVERPPRDIGRPVPFDSPASAPDAVLKEIALGSGLMALAIRLAPRRRKPSQR